MESLIRAIQNISQQLGVNANDVKIFEKSYNRVGKCHFMMLKMKTVKYILMAGQGRLFDELGGETIFTCKLCPLTHSNRLVFNKYLDYSVPKAFGPNVATFGVGDRLGITSAAHIKVLANSGIKPILAQQSMRELALTCRSYDAVLDAACYAVIQEGYKDGFGADGDHLKLEKDISNAIQSGVSMITLDCSEHINYVVEKMSFNEINNTYAQLPEDIRDSYEKNYLGRKFFIGETVYEFSEELFKKNVLVYVQVIEFIQKIYKAYVVDCNRKIDFEISLDETDNATSLLGHLLVASEMVNRKIEITSMAPRFVGEFQKGIDYIGDIAEFEENISEHAQIADHFGYKLSIHSGSDKFSVFNIVGKTTRGRFHIKTSGTNWLEAVRVISAVNPDLYRRMHKFAMQHFEEARAYYHVSADVKLIKNIDLVSDRQLQEYLTENNARQMMHITYGLILNAKESDKFIFRDDIFSTLEQFTVQYEEAIVKHIGKHIDYLIDNTAMKLSLSNPTDLNQFT